MYMLMTMKLCLTNKRLSSQWNAVSGLPCCFVESRWGCSNLTLLFCFQKDS